MRTVLILTRFEIIDRIIYDLITMIKLSHTFSVCVKNISRAQRMVNAKVKSINKCQLTSGAAANANKGEKAQICMCP